MEIIANYFQHINPYWVYFSLFAIAYIENIFPPSPSDMIIVAGGSLIGLGQVEFLPALISATLGSTAGFFTMYKMGEWFGESIIKKDKWKFIPKAQVLLVESWFKKYGNWLIVANRFMSGTRAVISVFAGMAELNLKTTTTLSFLSSLLWNGILVYAGMMLGQNSELIGLYLATYSKIVTGGLIVIAIISIVVWYYRRNRTS